MAVDVRTMTIVHPAAEDATARVQPAPRLATLAGATVGLIDNSKRNSDAFLADLRDLLRERYGVAGFDYYKKASPSIPTPPEVMRRLVEGCQAVVHAVAD
ncbi:MAG: hypothetical protein HY691_17605 [Chloroflexi bacterium]|nr:hypothetical protein [Chloroflexota bacterium]